MELGSAVLTTVLTVFVLNSRHVTRACQCDAVDHPQQRFCRADYAIIGRIVERIEEPEDSSEFPQFPFDLPSEDNNVPIPLPSTDAPPPQEPVLFGEFPILRKVQAPAEPVYLPPLMVNDGPTFMGYPGFQEQRGVLKYVVQVEKVFTGESDVLKESKVVIQTDLSSSLCGMTNLNLEERYLITGSIVDGQLSLYLCDWVQRTTELTKTQRRGLRHLYGKYCDTCRIETGTFYFPGSTRARGVCSYNSHFYGGMDCEAKFSSCLQRPNGSCGWYKGKDYKMCKKASSGQGAKRSGQ